MTKNIEHNEENIFTDRHRICEIIKKARISRGWNQGDLANAVGIKRTHISRIESGKYNFTVNNLLMIMKALDINVISISEMVDDDLTAAMTIGDDVDIDIVGNPNYPSVKLVRKKNI